MDRIIKKKKWTLKRIAVLSISGIFFIWVFYYIFFADHSSRLNVRTERITISSVKVGPFQEFIPVIGNVVPITTIYLDAIEGGVVEKIFLEAGTFVNKGEKILKLANTNLILDIMYREAELFQQSNNLRNTRLAMEQNRLILQGQLIDLDYEIRQTNREYERARDLLDKKLVSIKECEDAEYRYEYLIKKRGLTLETHRQDSIYRAIQIQQLETSLQRMEDNLKIVKQNMDNLILKAPITGHLTSLNAEVGQSKTRGQRLGQIDVLDGFKVRVPIDEHYIARINLGQNGSFTFANKEYELIIKKIYPEVVEGRFKVDMQFTGDEPEGIRRGQTLHIRLELGDLSQATLLAVGGFYQKTGGQWVYVIDESGQIARKRKIKLGRQNTEVYEVLDGLTQDERVITSSYDNYGEIDVLVLK